MALIGLKLCQNAFQTIPDISFFDAEKKIVNFSSGKIQFFASLARFLRSYGQMDFKFESGIKFCSR